MITKPKTSDVKGAKVIGNWGNERVPVFDVLSMHSFNQLVGYVKHINASNGTVLYRGQCELYNSITPSIFHNSEKDTSAYKQLDELIDCIQQDEFLRKAIGFNSPDIKGWLLFEKIVIEAMLQHYGAKTYCVDFVDNHWTSLWFGANRWDKKNCRYQRRTPSDYNTITPEICFLEEFTIKENPSMPSETDIVLSPKILTECKEDSEKCGYSCEELMSKRKDSIYKKVKQNWQRQCADVREHNKKIKDREKEAFVYIFLFVAETNAACFHGLYLGEHTYTVDLRKALPSIFLRPCSQHGWIVRGIDKNYDFNKNIACVIRMSVSLATEMLGNGTLLSQENFFPPYTVDQGLKILLQRQEGAMLDSKLNKLLPPNTIVSFE